MNNFWDNINKFPRFLISIILGFFLTTFRQIFRLFKNKKISIIIVITTYILLSILYKIIENMLGIQ
uniref:Uncharacterized protein ycf33 n=1 Tax=Anotrichium furcellatum TaxID=41999 RepID=A0A4D6WM77_9FLOR|nr:hypothetical protein [Anotrichium furcellatum]